MVGDCHVGMQLGHCHTLPAYLKMHPSFPWGNSHRMLILRAAHAVVGQLPFCLGGTPGLVNYLLHCC